MQNTPPTEHLPAKFLPAKRRHRRRGGRDHLRLGGAGAAAHRAGRGGARLDVDAAHDRGPEGLLQGARHQGRGLGHRHHGVGAAGAKPDPGHGSRHDGRLFQCPREGLSHHHRQRPRGHADPAQAADPARPEGPDQEDRRSQGQDHRGQRNRLGGQLRARQAARDRGPDHQGRRAQGASVPADGRRPGQQGGRRRGRDPAVGLPAGGSEHRRRAGRRRRPRQADPAQHRGGVHQYRLGAPRIARSRATSSSPISAAFGNIAKPTTTGRTGRK